MNHKPKCKYKLKKSIKGMIKNILDEDPFYNTKILIFSFTWAGLAAFHKSSTI